MKYYHWTLAGRKPIYGRGEGRPIGEWQRVEGNLCPCSVGLHACFPSEVPYWCGEELWEVEVRGEHRLEIDKSCWRERRYVRQLAWTQADIVQFARWCAERARSHSIAPLPAASAKWAADWAAISEAAASRAAALRATALRAAAATPAVNVAPLTVIAAACAADAVEAAAEAAAWAADAASKGAVVADAASNGAAVAVNPAGLTATLVAASAARAERRAQREWIEGRIGEKLED